MHKKLRKLFRRQVSRKKFNQEIDPDQIFLDAANLPKFDRDQFEGRLEKPIAKLTVVLTGVVFILIALVFGFKVWSLQISDGELYNNKSEQNHLRHGLIFSARGVIYDRRGEILAYNEDDKTEPEVARRRYDHELGSSLLLGHIQYPAKDKYGFYYETEYRGLDGVEKIFNSELSGDNGLKIIETNALGKVESESVIRPPRDGASLTLSIDSRVQGEFYSEMKALADRIGFTGGAGVIMDVKSGEILSITSFPEYNSEVLSEGGPAATIKQYVNDRRKPFLNRAADGLYTPGSIVKPFVALGALDQGIITPETRITSTGSISVPNPYDSTKFSVFNDWRAHGSIDLREALAVSSDVYFYEIGGGFEKQAGLGITKLEHYLRLFGLAEMLPEVPLMQVEGVIPNPEWKAENFDGDPWRLGDTYNTSIGQYGVQVTPLQMARAVAAIANGGKLLNPTILKTEPASAGEFTRLPIREQDFEVVKEGMRLGVTSPKGTAQGLNIPQVAVAAKTGTAELGVRKQYVNSWVIGFFPMDAPRYAFAVMMESGPRDNTVGALYAFRQLLEWMAIYTPEYL